MFNVFKKIDEANTQTILIPPILEEKHKQLSICHSQITADTKVKNTNY